MTTELHLITLPGKGVRCGGLGCSNIASLFRRCVACRKVIARCPCESIDRAVATCCEVPW